MLKNSSQGTSSSISYSSPDVTMLLPLLNTNIIYFLQNIVNLSSILRVSVYLRIHQIVLFFNYIKYFVSIKRRRNEQKQAYLPISVV